LGDLGATSCDWGDCIGISTPPAPLTRDPALLGRIRSTARRIPTPESVTHPKIEKLPLAPTIERSVERHPAD